MIALETVFFLGAQASRMGEGLLTLYRLAFCRWFNPRRLSPLLLPFHPDYPIILKILIRFLPFHPRSSNNPSNPRSKKA